MSRDILSLMLVKLAPDYEVSFDIALGFSAQLANILNTDDGLLFGNIRQQNGSPETAESLLSFSKEWCLQKNAETFVIVLEGNVVIGSISLSHYDEQLKCARTGYFIASEYQGKGYGSGALLQLVNMARVRGLKKVSATIPSSKIASRRIWEKCGVIIEFCDDEVTAILDG